MGISAWGTWMFSVDRHLWPAPFVVEVRFSAVQNSRGFFLSALHAGGPARGDESAAGWVLLGAFKVRDSWAREFVRGRSRSRARIFFLPARIRGGGCPQFGVQPGSGSVGPQDAGRAIARSPFRHRPHYPRNYEATQSIPDIAPHAAAHAENGLFDCPEDAGKAHRNKAARAVWANLNQGANA